MKIELRNILKENCNPSTGHDIKTQAQVTDLMKSGVAQGLIRKDFTVKSLNIAEPMDGDKITPNIDHSSQASTSVTSKAVKNNRVDSSFDWGVAWAFTCLKLSSPENKKKALRLEQDQHIKEAEELMKANSITAMRTDSELYEGVIQTVYESKAHPDHETSIQVGRERDKKLEEIMMEGKCRGLVKDPDIAPEEQRMLINKIAEVERIGQREAHNSLINTTPDPTFITWPSRHHRELSQLQKILGGSASIRDRPAPALVWRQRGYQAAELEYTNQKDPEEKGYSWRPKDPLILGPKDSTTFKEKRMIYDGKEMLKGTLSGYGGNSFPEVKDGEFCSEGGG